MALQVVETKTYAELHPMDVFRFAHGDGALKMIVDFYPHWQIIKNYNSTANYYVYLESETGTPAGRIAQPTDGDMLVEVMG